MLNADQGLVQKEIDRLIARVDELSFAASTSITNSSNADLVSMIGQAIHEINVSVEKLAVSQEELSAQQEELLLAQVAVVNEQLRYQNLFEFAPDGYLLTSTQGKILEANRRSGELLLYQPQALAGNLLVNLVDLEDRKQFHQKMAKLQRTIEQSDFGTANPLGDFQARAIHGEWDLRLRMKTGAHFDAAISYVVSPENGQTVIRWLIRDITPSKTLEQNYRRLLRRLVNTQEAERQRLSRELHDQMGQKIAALTLGLISLESEVLLTQTNQ